MADPNSPAFKMAQILMNSPVGQKARNAVGSSGPGSSGGTGGPPPLTKDRVMAECAEHFNDLWNASRPHTTNIPNSSKLLPGANPVSKKEEQGCWVLYNSVTGALRMADFTIASTRDGCSPGTPPTQTNEVAACWFHTHPNTSEEGYDKGPSSADLNVSAYHNCPGVVRSQLGGLTWFGPVLN